MLPLLLLESLLLLPLLFLLLFLLILLLQLSYTATTSTTTPPSTATTTVTSTVPLVLEIVFVAHQQLGDLTAACDARCVRVACGSRARVNGSCINHTHTNETNLTPT